MNALFTVLTVLIIIAAILLVAVVLLQNGKGEGLASNFVAGNQTFGVRQTADILEKITWGLVIAIVVLSVISAFTTGTNGTEVDVTNKIENVATDQQPEFPTAPIQMENPATETAE
ncbi:MAG: preprotein translocase subunit SecG [Bacteroidales bacterium]|nr:preprotein translocase subunit SecG [Bacteroidales bacterium]